MKGNGCDEKDDDTPGMIWTKKLTLKKFLEIFHDIERIKNKILKSGSRLTKVYKRCSLYIVSYTTLRSQTLTLLTSILYKDGKHHS